MIKTLSPIFCNNMFRNTVFGGAAFSLGLTSVYAEIIADGSMGPSGAITAVNSAYTIPEELGTTTGNNLFHSFSSFNIESGNSANFTGSANITNVIARVTGDSFSSIDGSIGCTIPGANLYLINPNGILFGAGAMLNVSGSFYASTADYLGFESGKQFHADLNQPVSLAISNPSSFGFLQADPAGITVNGGHLNVGEGMTLGLIGGNLTIIGNNISATTDPADLSIPANLGATSGNIDLVSVNSAGETVIGNNEVDSSSFTAMGDIILANQAMVTASGNTAGSIVIRGGNLVMVQSYLYANAYGASNGSPSKGIDIDLRNDLTMEYLSIIGTDVVGAASDNAGININADNILVNNGSDMESAVWNGSTNGNSGDIDVTANSLTVSNYGFIQTYTGTNSVGSAGSINMHTGLLNLLDGGQINSLGYSLYGTTGDINIDAQDILISGVNLGATDTGIKALSATQISNDVADINIDTNTLTIDQAFIGSATYSAKGGDIAINAKDISIKGTETIFAGIQTNNNYIGQGGTIILNASGQLVATDHALIQTATTYSGASGDININAGYLELSYAGKIVSGGSGGAGGDSGDITIDANRIALLGLEHTALHQSVDATGIISGADANGGITGDITINSAALDMDNRAFISSSSYGTGNAGNIGITSQAITINSGALISSSALDSGNGGDIIIQADNLTISGVHPDIFTDQFSNLQSLAISGIASQTSGLGNAGDINLYIDNVTLMGGGRVTSETYGVGSGGDISIEGRTLSISGASTLIDNAGFVSSSGIFASASLNDAFSATGNGGNIHIQSDQVSLSDHAMINSDTSGPGNAGDITIDAVDFDMASGASIITKSTDTGDAGNIAVSASNNAELSGSLINTQAENANGGNIVLRAGNTLTVKNSAVSASVLAQDGNGGNIDISADLVALNHATITAGAVEGHGGNITINSNHLVQSANTVIDASSEKSISGVIQLSPESGATSALSRLSEETTNIAATFARDCAAMDSSVNSLIVSNNPGDIIPGTLLPSTAATSAGDNTASQSARRIRPKIMMASISNIKCQP